MTTGYPTARRRSTTRARVAQSGVRRTGRQPFFSGRRRDEFEKRSRAQTNSAYWGAADSMQTQLFWLGL